MKKGPILSLNVFKDPSSVRSCFAVRFCVCEWPGLYRALCNASSKNASLELFSELCNLPVLYLMYQTFTFLIIFCMNVPEILLVSFSSV